MRTLILSLLFLLVNVLLANIAAANNQFTTIRGDTVTIPQKGPAHLVFIDIWGSYGGEGPEATLQALSESFHETVPTFWIQPRMNVNDAQVLEYQQAFPASTPLIMDNYLQLMRKYGVESTPAHVLLEDGKVMFSGSTEAFLTHVGHESAMDTGAASTNQPTSSDSAANEDQNAQNPESEKEDDGLPSARSIANLEEFLFASGEVVHLIFLDDLCPMPHFPGCEKTVKQISESYRKDHNWILIYNSLYSDPSTAKAFSEKHNLTMPALFDEDQTLFKRYQVRSTPYFIQMERDGKILYRGSEVSSLIEVK